MNTFKHSVGCISEIYKNVQKAPLTLIWDSISLAWILQLPLIPFTVPSPALPYPALCPCDFPQGGRMTSKA